MSSPELSEDDDNSGFGYERYEPLESYLANYKAIDIDRWNSSDISLETLLIAASAQNRVDQIKKLLDSPELYNVKNAEDGNDLLQIAVINKNKEVFDYLLSLEGFPLEHKNVDSKTALELTLVLRGDFEFFDYIAHALVEKGVSPHSIELRCGENLLHAAAETYKVKLTKLLLKLGVDHNALNTSGYSPLWYCLESSYIDEKVENEIVTALLSYGADPTVGLIFGLNTFEYAVKMCSDTLKEALFYYMIDEYTQMDVHFEVLLILANDDQSPFFHETIKRTSNVILENSSLSYYYLIFLIDTVYLEALIDKCPEVIQQLFDEITPNTTRFFRDCGKMSLANFEALLRSELREDTITFITTFSDKYYFYSLLGLGGDETQVLSYLCYLLSYGLRIHEMNLKTFYEKYGYGPLVQTLLHMDVEILLEKCVFDAFLLFIFDVTLTIDEYLRDLERYSIENASSLLQYFCHPKHKSLCYDEDQESLCEAIDKLPQVPLLTELARNSFRQYFIKTFKIKKAREFYSLLNSLDVSNTYKKIITYETKLYELRYHHEE